MKTHIETHLHSLGWNTKIQFGHKPGIDIDARKQNERWIIEVKGCGSRPQMRVNYFLCALGELLQRMNDDNARYSVAMADLPQFRGLWARLPTLPKQRLGITALFVDASGEVREVR